MSQPYIPPQTIISTYSHGEWEIFIEEWIQALKNSGKYSHIQRLGGAGDEGRDIVGHTVKQLFTEPWVNYQCKHYDKKLGPVDISKEVCKHVFYSYKGEYIAAREYYFVSPQGISTASAKMLGDPQRLKKKVLEDWNSVAEKYAKIESLNSALERYIESFDFTIFGSVPPLDIVTQHSKTQWHAQRFGHVPMPKMATQSAPDTVGEHEVPYIRCILDAYEDKNGCTVKSIQDLSLNDQRDVKDNRDEFYNAEYFKSKSREIRPPEDFDSLQDDIYHSISNMLKGSFSHGIERLNHALERVVQINLGNSNSLAPELRPIHKKGICHQLAQLGRVFWSNRNYD